MFIKGIDGVLINTDFVVSFYIRPANVGVGKMANYYVVCASDANGDKYDLSKNVNKATALKIIDKVHRHVETVNQYEVPEVTTKHKPVELLSLDDKGGE